MNYKFQTGLPLCGIDGKVKNFFSQETHHGRLTLLPILMQQPRSLSRVKRLIREIFLGHDIIDNGTCSDILSVATLIQLWCLYQIRRKKVSINVKVNDISPFCRDKEIICETVSEIAGRGVCFMNCLVLKRATGEHCL